MKRAILNRMPSDAPQPPNPTSRHGCQFTLATIFLATTAVAAILASATQVFGRTASDVVAGLKCLLAFCVVMLAVMFLMMFVLFRLERSDGGHRRDDDHDSI
jgi:hypothetical protein